MQRCIEEEEHAQAVFENSGKELGFFQAPSLLTRETRERFRKNQRQESSNGD